MSERTVTLRHDQICDLCHGRIPAGEKAYLIRDDFWPMNVWFEHCGGCSKDKYSEAPVAENKPTSTPTNKEQ